MLIIQPCIKIKYTVAALCVAVDRNHFSSDPELREERLIRQPPRPVKNNAENTASKQGSCYFCRLLIVPCLLIIYAQHLLVCKCGHLSPTMIYRSPVCVALLYIPRVYAVTEVWDALQPQCMQYLLNQVRLVR